MRLFKAISLFVSAWVFASSSLFAICASGSYSKGEYPPDEKPGTGPYEGMVHGSQHPDYKIRPGQTRKNVPPPKPPVKKPVSASEIEMRPIAAVQTYSYRRGVSTEPEAFYLYDEDDQTPSRMPSQGMTPPRRGMGSQTMMPPRSMGGGDQYGMPSRRMPPRSYGGDTQYGSQTMMPPRSMGGGDQYGMPRRMPPRSFGDTQYGSQGMMPPRTLDQPYGMRESYSQYPTRSYYQPYSGPSRSYYTQRPMLERNMRTQRPFINPDASAQPYSDEHSGTLPYSPPPPHAREYGLHRQNIPGPQRHAPGRRSYIQDDHYRSIPGSGYWHRPEMRGESQPVQTGDQYLPSPTPHEYRHLTPPPGAASRQFPIRTPYARKGERYTPGQGTPPPYHIKPDSTGEYYPNTTRRGGDIFYGQRDYSSNYGPAKLRNEAMQKNITQDLGHPNVNVHVHDGVVTLTGIVNSDAEKKEIEMEIRSMPGVAGVDNRLQTNPTVPGR